MNQYQPFQKIFFKLEIYKILHYGSLSVSHFTNQDLDTYSIPMQIVSGYIQ